MYDKYGQFIDGKWQKSASGETYDVINPATEELIGKASKANSTDIQKALKSAKKGLELEILFTSIILESLTTWAFVKIKSFLIKNPLPCPLMVGFNFQGDCQSGRC